MLQRNFCAGDAANGRHYCENQVNYLDFSGFSLKNGDERELLQRNFCAGDAVNRRKYCENQIDVFQFLWM
uniref:Uncharacterized protein n=1 Tax=Strongyloides papillosus TaxID=174720 RepID=A0A0N5C7P2_STREA